MSPSASTFMPSTRPVRTYHFCSAGIRWELWPSLILVPTPAHAYICEGVTALIWDLSAGGRLGSIFAAQRATPCAPLQTLGDVKLVVAVFFFVAAPRNWGKARTVWMMVLSMILGVMGDRPCMRPA